MGVVRSFGQVSEGPSAKEGLEAQKCGQMDPTRYGHLYLVSLSFPPLCVDGWLPGCAVFWTT